jgi:hypothetical protein
MSTSIARAIDQFEHSSKSLGRAILPLMASVCDCQK